MDLAQRDLRDDTTRELLGLTRQLADEQLRPAAAEAERAGRFPREKFALLGEAGLLGLPYPEELGGG
ncbi:MAG TPA: acyl-CoA dehydrogenase family protein, partial [Streptosporangiaceae bacterium]